jgi:dTDP-4-dehydrorhamnose reductase
MEGIMKEDSLNIIVIGCNGKLGQDLIELFNCEDKEKFFVRGVDLEDCDITKKADVYNLLDGTSGSITNVINCAAMTDVDKCESFPELADNINNKAIQLLSEVCIKNEIHLTHISTDYVFEGLKTTPYLEQDEAVPLSVYGKSKLAGEGWVRGMGDKGLVIRTAWLYGKHGKNFIDVILNKLELGLEVPVLVDQIGNPTYSMDLANVIIQLASSFKSGLFHATNSGFCSWFEFASKAAEYMDFDKSLIKPMQIKDLVRKAERPKYSVLSLNRLDRTLPEPVRKWQDALYQYLIETKRLYEHS